MKNFILFSLFILIGTGTIAQQEVDCRMPIQSPYIKMEHTKGFDLHLGDAELHNYLSTVKNHKSVYLYFNRNGTWQLLKECAIPKGYVKSFYFKNGIQYGVAVHIKDRPTVIHLNTVK